MSSERRARTVFICIGNSDDKLSQMTWSTFCHEVKRLVIDCFTGFDVLGVIHGEWFSRSDAAWQNACWCVELGEVAADSLRAYLGDLATKYQQDNIAWFEATGSFVAPDNENSPT